MIVRKKCKTSFKLDLYEFEEGMYYKFYRREFLLREPHIQVIYYDEDDNLPIISEVNANKFFYTENELRKMKIQKIIKDNDNRNI